MRKEDLETFEGKNIKIILQNSYQYNGHIINISDDCLNFKDRDGNIILISFSNIKFIRENKNGI